VRPAAATRLDSLDRLLRDAGASDITVGQVAALLHGRRPTFSAVARWDPERYSVLSREWFSEAVITVSRITNTFLAPLLDSVPARKKGILEPADSLLGAMLTLAQAANQEKLRRYELKYGPTAPRLNAAEVALNYLLQFVPGLGVRADGSPTPWEAVAAYRTTELTAVTPDGGDPRVRVVSGARLGLRYYTFDAQAGTGSLLTKLRHPGSVSAGLFLMGPRDEPLDRAWGSGSRPGIFLGWGDVHVSYVFGTERRVVVGSGKLVVPYVF
jgi:hypothetical protein